MALKGLGVDGESLPFDWARTSMDGLLHTLRTDFADFLKHDYVTDDNHVISWGHAFFHHDPRDPEDAAKYQRRIRRFRDLRREAPASRALLFVRSAAAAHELRGLAELYGLLVEAFDCNVWLLCILDHQPSELPVLFEDQPRVMVHTLSDRRCRPEGYSIEESPFVSAYHDPIQLASDWARGGHGPAEHVLLPSVSLLAEAPGLLAPLPRALLRHASLCEDLTQPFCFDPQMPPEDVIEWSLTPAGSDFLPFVREMIGEHFVALLRLQHPHVRLCRRQALLRTAEGARAAAAEGRGAGAGTSLAAGQQELLCPAVEAFLRQVKTRGIASLRRDWALFWSRELAPLAQLGGDENASGGGLGVPEGGGGAAGSGVGDVGPELGGRAGAAPAAGRRPQNPEDGRDYTYEELLRVCAGFWTESEVRAFWDAECTPLD